MKPFHYHEDPLYAAVTAILKGQTVTEQTEQLEEASATTTLEESMELDESIKTRIADLLLNLSGSDTSDMIKLAADTFKKNALALSHSVAADKKDEYEKAIKDMYAELLDSKTLTDFEKNGKKLAVQMKSFKEDTAVEEEVSIEEGNGSYNMGTATITAPGNKLNGKQVSIFHKFDDGRLNVQYAKSDKKGDVLNLTLNKGQYKVNESVELEEAYTTKNASVRKVTAMVDEFSNSEMEDLLFSLAELQLAGGNGDNAEQIALGKLLQKAATIWKNRSQFDESTELEETALTEAEEVLQEAVEISDEDMKVINDIKKIFPSGSVIDTWSGSLEWEKRGGYAGEKSVTATKEKLDDAGFKFTTAKSLGLPSGSTAGFRSLYANEKLGWYVTIVMFYGNSSSSNAYKMSLKKLV